MAGADKPTEEAFAAAPWSWKASVDPKKELLAVVVLAGCGLVAGLIAGGSPALIVGLTVGGALFAVLVLLWMRTHDARTWAILHPDGRLEWNDPDQHGVIDLRADGVHTAAVKRTVKGGNRRYHTDLLVMGPGPSPVLRGKDEGEPPEEKWAEVAGFRMQVKQALVFAELIKAAGAYTDVQATTLVLTERVTSPPFGKAEVEGLPSSG